MNFTTNIFTQQETLTLVCKNVPEFPAGIKESFDELVLRYPDPDGKGYYGISWMDDQGEIIYKAAALSDGGSCPPEYEEFVFLSGNYLAITLKQWMEKIPQMKDAFHFLMQDPRFNDQYPCVEWYKSDEEMICMVRMRH